MVIRHRNCGQPVHAELRYAHDHRVFEVEETESGPRPGVTGNRSRFESIVPSWPRATPVSP